jgi:hypothetical protein
MRLRPPQTYREFLKAGALSLSTPTLMFVGLAISLIQLGDYLLATAIVGLWALVMLIAIILVIYRVETSRQLDRRRQSQT